MKFTKIWTKGFVLLVVSFAYIYYICKVKAKITKILKCIKNNHFRLIVAHQVCMKKHVKKYIEIQIHTAK